VVNDDFLYMGVRSNSMCVSPRPTLLFPAGLLRVGGNLLDVYVPTSVLQQNLVGPLLNQVSAANVAATVSALATSFNNRYFQSESPALAYRTVL
jgi:hypothetical protein